jgi:hypothetical protein
MIECKPLTPFLERWKTFDSPLAKHFSGIGKALLAMTGRRGICLIL